MNKSTAETASIVVGVLVIAGSLVFLEGLPQLACAIIGALITVFGSEIAKSLKGKK